MTIAELRTIADRADAAARHAHTAGIAVLAVLLAYAGLIGHTL